jgi:hypothetical protein
MVGAAIWVVSWLWVGEARSLATREAGRSATLKEWPRVNRASQERGV